ncbi:MAG: DUF6090 family protein [Draconibacterium sp.]
MVHFFSKIRYKLAAENRVARYLRYAIGEILLVVIGILIALQINNWNEKQKAKVYEIKMLSEIRNAMISDIKLFDMLANTRLAKIDSFNTVLLDLYMKKEPVPDSVLNNISILNWGYLFNYNSGPYEAVKSSGMDKISNDSIRNALAALYDYYLPRTKLALEMIDKSLNDQPENFNKLFEQVPYYDNKDKIGLRWQSKYKNVWLREEYQPLLITTKVWINEAKLWINGGARIRMENCLRLIDKEFSKSSTASNAQKIP